MTRIILLHGGYDIADYNSRHIASASNRQWLPWLQNELLIAGHDAQTPEVFNSSQFEYEYWESEFERHLSDSMMLVGHSTGAGFFLRWFSENPYARVQKLILVAPYIDPFGLHVDDKFFDFDFDPQLQERVGELHVFHSIDDAPEIVASVERLMSMYRTAIEHRYEKLGHFTTVSMGTDAFPDLLKALIS